MNPRSLVLLAVVGASSWMADSALAVDATPPETPTPTGAAALPPLADVFQMLEDSRFAEAASLLQRLAETGDARAQLFRGLTFLTGAGVKVDWDAGRTELRRAAASGNRHAALFLMRTASKESTERERADWLELAQRSPVKREWVPATLGFVEDGALPDLNRLSAVQWNRTNAATGDPMACYNLARYHLTGFGVRQDQDEYRRWLAKAGEAGFAPALEEMALNAFLGLFGETEDRARGAALELRAAEAGAAAAQFSVAEDFLEGRAGREQNAAAAVKWLEKAAAQDHAKALAELADLLRDGTGTAQDDRRAVALYERAARLGNADARSNLGWMHENGHGVPKDPARAAALYREAADSGDMWALKALGILYRDGTGVPQDLAKARELFQRSADGGNAQAMNALGWLYSEGKGLPKDEEAAFEWFEKAAREGHADSQNTVGWRLLQGLAVERDPQEAITWFKLAAEKGNETAMVNLLDAYRQGHGGRVPRDEIGRWQEKLAELRGPLLRIEFLRDEVFGQPDEAKAARALVELRSLLKHDDPKVASAAKAALADALLGALHPEHRAPLETLQLATELHDANDRAGTIILAKLLYAGAKGVPLDVPRSLALLQSLGEQEAGAAMFRAAIELNNRPHEEGARDRGWALMADAATAGYEPAKRLAGSHDQFIREHRLQLEPSEAEFQSRIRDLGDRGAEAEATAVFAPRPVIANGVAAEPRTCRAALELCVDADGSVAEVKVVECSHDAYRDAAITAAKRWRFAPALRAGIPVPSRVKITLNTDQKSSP